MSGQIKDILADIQDYNERAIKQHVRYLQWRRQRTKAQRRGADSYHVDIIDAGHRDPMLPGPADCLQKLLEIELDQADLARIDGTEMLADIHKELGELVAMKQETRQTLEEIILELEASIIEHCNLTGSEKLNIRTYFMDTLKKIREVYDGNISDSD